MSGAFAWQIRKKLIKFKLFCFEREDREIGLGTIFFICPASLCLSLCCVCLASCASFSILLLFFTLLLCAARTLLQEFLIFKT